VKLTVTVNGPLLTIGVQHVRQQPQLLPLILIARGRRAGRGNLLARRFQLGISDARSRYADHEVWPDTQNVKGRLIYRQDVHAERGTSPAEKPGERIP